MSECKVCDKETDIVFNINLKAKPICESCATQITLQQVKDLCEKNFKQHQPLTKEVV